MNTRFFIKFYNNTTAVIKSSINVKKLFKQDEEIKIDLKLVNRVEEFVYSFFMNKKIIYIKMIIYKI